MFWNKKKSADKGLPDLPNTPKAAPSMRDYHEIIPPDEEEQEEIHGLPSFPDSPMERGFSQSAIKDAIGTEDIKSNVPDLPELPIVEERLRFSKEEGIPKIPPPLKQPKLIEIEEWKPSAMSNPSSPKKIIENKPIFVRLDKFQDAKDSLEIIKDKLRDIDGLLHSIREVKTKEDQELSSWEKDIESIKARINSVSSEVFDQKYS